MSCLDREEKVKKIFEQFDLNRDGGLNRAEMAALVVSVNPRGKFNNDDQINEISDQFFLTYTNFVDGEKGLSLEGLLRTYDDRAEDLDRDFQALGLHLNNSSTTTTTAVAMASEASSSSSSISIVEQKCRIAARPTFPKEGIVFDGTWEMAIALENRVSKLKAKQRIDEIVAVYFDHGCLTELEPFFPGKAMVTNESDRDYALFMRELGFFRYRVDGIQRNRSREEAFDVHMAMGRLLYFHQLFKDALVSFSRSSELERTDAPSRLWAGNCLCLLGRYRQAKEEFLWAHEIAEVDGNKWDYLLPQIHVNLGIAFEKEGTASKASEHYREAVVLCPQNFKYLRLLGSALLQAEDYIAAEKALEEASSLKADHADAHYDLGRVLHATGRNEKAIQEYRTAMELKPAGHVNAMYNLGVLYMEMGKYRMASAMFAKAIEVSPSNWRALVNKAVALEWVAGEGEEAIKDKKDAFKMMRNSVESQDMMMAHIKQLQKKLYGGSDERIKDVLIEVRRSYIKFIHGQSGGIIPNYFCGAENVDEASVSTAPQTNPEPVLTKGSKRSRAKQ